MAPAASPMPSSRSSVNVPFLAAAAVLIGIGLVAMTAWMVNQTWDWFALGIPTLGIGGLMLFHRATGPDTA